MVYKCLLCTSVPVTEKTQHMKTKRRICHMFYTSSCCPHLSYVRLCHWVQCGQTWRGSVPALELSLWWEALDSGVCDVGQEYQTHPCSHRDRNTFQKWGRWLEADCACSWHENLFSCSTGLRFRFTVLNYVKSWFNVIATSCFAQACKVHFCQN